MPSGPLVGGQLDSLVDSEGQRRRSGDAKDGGVAWSKVRRLVAVEW